MYFSMDVNYEGDKVRGLFILIADTADKMSRLSLNVVRSQPFIIDVRAHSVKDGEWNCYR